MADSGLISKREELIKLLSDNPSDLRSRVSLAKTFFEDGYYDFCLRELKEVSTDSAEVASLIAKIKSYLGEVSSDNSVRNKKGKTLAEIEF